MIDKNVDQIDIGDIKLIVESNVVEKKSLEFKSILPGQSHRDKREFLADVSSFANTEGGFIIYGVGESQIGQEVGLGDLGFETGDIDGDLSRLENLLRQAMSPRMNVDIGVVTNDNKFIVVIRIDPSLDAPHRVTLEGHDKFYRRNANGKYPMDVDELRTSFIKTSSLIDKVKGFVNKRIFDIHAGDVPFPIVSNSCFLSVHILPLSAFTTEHKLGNETMRSLSEGRYDTFRPFHSSSWSHRINLEGVVTYSSGGDGTVRTYTQMYRDGRVEAVESSTFESMKSGDQTEYFIPMGWLEPYVMNFAENTLKLLLELSFKPPFYVYLTLSGIRDFKVTIPKRYYQVDTSVMGVNELRLPPVIIDKEEFDKFQKFQPIFDIIWNASGVSRSLNFDADGKYIEL